MPPYRGKRRFSQYLMGAIFIVIIAIIIAGISLNLVNTSNNYYNNAQNLRDVTEIHINSSFRLINNGLKIYDNLYNRQMEAAFGVVLNEYNRTGGDPQQMDLIRLRDQIGMEIYFINISGVVEFSSSEQDRGLDFSVIYPDFYVYLQNIWNKPGFYPDRVVRDYLTGEKVKFAYMPSGDNRYIIELGMRSEQFSAERNLLRYADVTDAMIAFNPYLEKVRIFQKQMKPITDPDYIPTQNESAILSTLFRERRSLEFTDPALGKTVKYLFVDMRDPDYGADMSLTVELTYNDAIIQNDLRNLLFVHLGAGVVALAFGGLISLVISRRLARPIDTIVHDVDQIAQGDLDHQIPPGKNLELEVLGQSINEMVRKLKAALEQAKVSEEKYRELVENVNSIILRLDPVGQVVFINDYAQKFFGYSESEILGRNCVGTIVPEIDRSGVNLRDKILHLAQVPELYATTENENMKKSGERVWISWTNKQKFGPSGEVIEVLCIGNDITWMKQASEEIRHLNEDLERRVIARTSELEAANQELESFSYSVSHDLRAPLRAIDGYSSILTREYLSGLPPGAQEYLEKIRLNARHMGDLIDDILSYSRTGRVVLTKERVSPQAMVSETMESLKGEYKDRQVEFTLRELPDCVADPSMLRRVFYNLLSNALKFTRIRKKAEITVGSQTLDGQVVYFVQDNGVGFDPQYADRIFGVFQRLHKQGEYEGTGVGLAIVKRVIERHGGKIWAESESGKGSTFFFTLPF